VEDEEASVGGRRSVGGFTTPTRKSRGGRGASMDHISVGQLNNSHIGGEYDHSARLSQLMPDNMENVLTSLATRAIIADSISHYCSVFTLGIQKAIMNEFEKKSLGMKCANVVVDSEEVLKLKKEQEQENYLVEGSMGWFGIKDLIEL
jgi:hypothetical protein